MINLTEANFNDEVLNSQTPVLVDFWASWCQPCKMQSPILEEFEKLHPEVKVAKCNVDDQITIALKYGIQGIPALFLFQNGQIKTQAQGVHPLEALEALIKE
ncbi:MAG: thioredoxin [Treponema sp.]|nr:thioredoxin [Treponema sp.]